MTKLTFFLLKISSEVTHSEKDIQMIVFLGETQPPKQIIAKSNIQKMEKKVFSEVLSEAAKHWLG